MNKKFLVLLIEGPVDEVSKNPKVIKAYLG